MNVRTARGQSGSLRSHWWRTRRFVAGDARARERRRVGLLILASLVAVVELGVFGYWIGHETGVEAPVSDALRNQSYSVSFDLARTEAVGSAERAGQRAGDRVGLSAGKAAGARAGQRRALVAVRRERAALAKGGESAGGRGGAGGWEIAATAASSSPPASASAEEASVPAAPTPAPKPTPTPATPAPAPSPPAKKPPCFDAAGRPC